MEKINLRFGVLVAMVLAAAASRFLFLNEPNFTPIGALCLFGGAYFADKRWAFVVPLASVWVSNLVLDNVVYKQYNPTFSWGIPNSQSLVVFLTFALIVGMGIVFLKKITIKNFLLTSIGSALLFFVVTNFTSWLSDPIYTKNLAGLLTSYTMGLPFLTNTLVSQLFFGAVLFGGFELLKSTVWSKQLA